MKRDIFLFSILAVCIPVCIRSAPETQGQSVGSAPSQYYSLWASINHQHTA